MLTNKCLGNAEIQLIQKQLNKRRYENESPAIINENLSIFARIENSQLSINDSQSNEFSDKDEDVPLRKKVKYLEKKCLQWQEDYEILEEENYKLRKKLDQYHITKN